jgi:hypothetical protein
VHGNQVSASAARRARPRDVLVNSKPLGRALVGLKWLRFSAPFARPECGRSRLVGNKRHRFAMILVLVIGGDREPPEPVWPWVRSTTRG